MKKAFISLWLLVCCTFVCVVNAADVGIGDVVNAFNKGTVADSYKESGGSINAVYDKDSVDISIDIDGEDLVISYNLNGSIITANIQKNDKNAFTKSYLMQELIEVASVLHGYTYGDITSLINSGVIDDYTIDVHGFEQVLDSQGNVVIKVDVSKKIPSSLTNLNDVYLEKADLEDYKEFITSDGSCEKTKGNVYFYLTTEGSVKKIVLAEKGGITSNSYMSFRTVIDIMFDGNDNVINRISSFVPDFNYDVDTDGISVNLNESEISKEVSDYNTLKENGYSVILIKIDKAALHVTGEIIDDGSDGQNDNQTEEDKTKNEKKDKSSSLSPAKTKIIMIIVAVIVILVIVMIVINFKGKTPKKPKLVKGNKGVIQPSMMQTHTTDEIVESLDDTSTLAVQAQFNNSFENEIAEQNVGLQSDVPSFDNQFSVQGEEMMQPQDMSFDQPFMQDAQVMNQDMYNQQPMVDQNQMIQQQMMSQDMMPQQPMMNDQFVNNVSFDNNMNNNQNN